jgi:hypothetical protein
LQLSSNSLVGMLTGVGQQILICVKQFSSNSSYCQNHVKLHSINSLPSTFAFALASAYECRRNSNIQRFGPTWGLTFLPQLPRFRRTSEIYQHPSLPLPEVPANQNQNQTGWQITHTLSLSNPQPHLSSLPFSFGHPTKPYTWRMAIILLGTD